MLDLSDLNLLAIIAAWLVYVVVGAIWYSPVGFSKQWAKLSGVDIMKLPKSEANLAILSVWISSFIQVLTLAIMIDSLNVNNAVDGLILGLVLWLGLTAATTVGVTLYQRLSWKFILLNSSYFLIVMSSASLLLTVWQ